MGRSPCCEKTNTNKGAWTKEEDQLLINHINLHGEGNWRSFPKAAGLHRCGKSCRLRWINYLRPDLKRGTFSAEEDEIIIRLHTYLGNKWSLIAGRLPGRTDNEIKNYWNTHIKRKLINSGIDPQTHRPLNAAAAPPPPPPPPQKQEIVPINDPSKFLSLSNSSSVQESTTTEESNPPPPPQAAAAEAAENADDELDLELSIGLPSQARYAKSASFNSSSSSAETLFKAVAVEVVAPAVCMCPPFGVRKDQWCSNCRSRNGLFRF